MLKNMSVNRENISTEGQCQFFVTRKKRLCRMTVRPGRCYCGEHEPQPRIEEGQSDTRISCPNDPKHTVYTSKLEKHLSICNARQGELPPYIVHNINAPTEDDHPERIPLTLISRNTLQSVIDKINSLYEKHIEGHITSIPDREIHPAVLEQFNEPQRTEASRRHLRQASALLHLAEAEGLVAKGTCYVELGAGRGQLSYFCGVSWCGDGNSRVLCVDRAAVRHKRDNKLRRDLQRERHEQSERHERCARVRADLAHLALQHVPAVKDADSVVGLAKHLCGVAMDYALRCCCAARALALATCCHHRCHRPAYVANRQLQELGISGEDLNVMLGVVSWATCGDGRSRDSRQTDTNRTKQHIADIQYFNNTDSKGQNIADSIDILDSKDQNIIADTNDILDSKDQNNISTDSKDLGVKDNTKLTLTQPEREAIGRKAKALLDWGRVLYLRDKGFDARLVYYVSTNVSLENVCIIAKKNVLIEK